MKVSKASAYGLQALMYMVRHATQLPATIEAIAKTEAMPAGGLRKVLPCLVRAGFAQLAHGLESGYVFARPPEEIAPREIWEALEGEPLFDGRPLEDGERGEPLENRRALEGSAGDPRKVRELFGEATIVAAAWRDLEHRFGTLPKGTGPAPLQIKSLGSRRWAPGEESSQLG